MREKEYDREKVKEYAKKWAYSRNPSYYNYDVLGGDCTNFISQCIYAGSGIMNYQSNLGWYYKNGNQKSPSWTGVEFLYEFLIHNQSVGPFGREVAKEQLEIGDVIQLSFNGTSFGHSLVVVSKEEENILIAAHTFDTYGRNINTYSYEKIRYIHMEAVRTW